MKVIPEMCCAHLIWYLRFYYYHWVDTFVGELLVPEGNIRPVVSASALRHWHDLLGIYITEIYSS